MPICDSCNIVSTALIGASLGKYTFSQYCSLPLLWAKFSCRQYRRTAHLNVTHRRRQNFYALKTNHWQTLAAAPFNILENLDRVDDGIDANADIAYEILAHGLPSFGLDQQPPSSSDRDWRGTASAEDMNKVRTTINQFYRDWSAEGAAERDACLKPVLNDLDKLFPLTQLRGDVRILVPGAGLGRLIFELCRYGYTVEGNEISYHQLLASSWVLNHVQRAQQFALYPFALEFNNLINRKYQLKEVKIPDVHPATELEKASHAGDTHTLDRMSMTASDFVVLYGDEEHREGFDVVATVFFIDTAPNLMRYIEVVWNCLKEGGVWINIGPLLWHFGDRAPREGTNGKGVTEGGGEQRVREKEGIDEPGSVELTVEEVLLLIGTMGFGVEKHEIRSEGAGYIQNPESMLSNLYSLSHWIARKKPTC